MQQYLCGDALKSAEGLGHSGYTYKAAKERLERKYRGQRQKILLHRDDLEKFKPIQSDAPKELERLADLVDIAVTNLKEAKHEEELVNGTFYRKLLHKLPEKTVTLYHRWIFEQRKTENVQKFRSFILQEA